MSRKKDPRLSDPIQVRLFKDDQEVVEEISRDRNIPVVELIRGLAQAGLRAIKDHQIELKSVGDQILFERARPAPQETVSFMEDKPIRKPKPPEGKTFVPPPPPPP